MELTGKRVLVTGGAGFMGSHLVDRIIRDRPADVVVLDNLWLGREANLRDARRLRSVPLYVLDATDLRAVQRVLRERQIAVVFDLATIPLPASLERPHWALESIIRMTSVITELVRGGEYETLVHVSSSEVYGNAEKVPMTEVHRLNPRTPYAAAKAAGDLIVRSYWETFGIDATIIRPFNAYGPRQNDRDHAGIVPRVMRCLWQGTRPVIYGDGDQTRDYLYIEDTVEAIVLSYRTPESRRRVIHVASGIEISIRDLVARICRATGIDLDPVHLPERPGDIRRHVVDVRLAREVLGFLPQIGMDEGLRRTVAWAKEHWQDQ